MKGFAIGLAAVVMGTVPALADPPVKTMETSLGVVFVDDKGMTLYTFDKDEDNMSNCYDQCATNWPPLMAEGDAMPTDEWTVVERNDGTKMWAYDGDPVYLWVKDEKPGDVTGDGVGDVWHVAKPIED